MKVYISGAISGVEHDNEPAFRNAESILEDMGYDTIVPHDQDPNSDNPEWEDYMRSDIKAMMDADVVVALHNDSYSRGSHVEQDLARRLSIPVIPLSNMKPANEMLWPTGSKFRKEVENV